MIQSPLHSISTLTVPPRDRLAMWGSVVWKHVGSLKSDAFGDASFDGTLDYADVGQMKVARIVAGRHRVTRQPLAFTDSYQRYVKICVQVKGVSSFEQHGRSMRLAPGQWGAYDTAKPYVVTNPEAVEQLAFLIPHDQLARDISLKDLAGQPFSSVSGVSRLVSQSISTLLEQLPLLHARSSQELANVIARLFQLAVYEKTQRPDAELPQPDARDRIHSYIETRLRDSQLNLDRIATDLRCTKRYLHLAFAGQAHTLNEYIWSRRLEGCRADLQNPAMRDKSITEIAMSWGFSNLSHFSRVFRERYGAAPRDVKAGLM
jgi:AraC-like DNA-binding protein